MNENEITEVTPSPIASDETASEVVSVDYSELLAGISSRQDLIISLDFMLLLSVWVCVGVMLVGVFRGH